MDEFALIEMLLEALGDQKTGAAIMLGPGDDAALVEPVAGQWLVSSIDTLVAGIHFPADAGADLVGYRALAVSISDLAAMGADPLYCLIALTVPAPEPAWVQRFASGVAAASFAFRCPVAGGNIACGPLNVSVSVHGQTPAGEALRRSGARPGHRVMVSGRFGAAAAALGHPDLSTLRTLAEVRALQAREPETALARYYLPRPRLELGRTLRGIAAAAIDVSDGLLADLGHICSASGCAAAVDVASIPRGGGATLEQALTGGDDYELCLVVPPDRVAAADAVAAAIGVQLTDIGQIIAGDRWRLTDDGRPFEAPLDPAGGYRHFG
jgi:thiamine-monophosphate kinase